MWWVKHNLQLYFNVLIETSQVVQIRVQFYIIEGEMYNEWIFTDAYIQL